VTWAAPPGIRCHYCHRSFFSPSTFKINNCNDSWKVRNLKHRCGSPAVVQHNTLLSLPFGDGGRGGGGCRQNMSFLKSIGRCRKKKKIINKLRNVKRVVWVLDISTTITKTPNEGITCQINCYLGLVIFLMLCLCTTNSFAQKWNNYNSFLAALWIRALKRNEYGHRSRHTPHQDAFRDHLVLKFPFETAALPRSGVETSRKRANQRR